jgi:hypothetical protein
MDMDLHQFSADYDSARDKFRRAAAVAGAQLDQIILDARGPDEQELTIDIARLGEAGSKNVLLHMSGSHGIEGLAGSAIQIQILQSPPRFSAADSIVLIHGVNPFGMAWWRRVNENNVDLNRNFLSDDEEYFGTPEGYCQQDQLLNPKSASQPFDAFYARLLWYILRLGFAKWKESVASGQYDHAKGLFYGGRRLEQGPSMLLDWLRSRLRGVARLLMIDVHTGLGRFARDSLIVCYPPDTEKFRLLGRELGDRVVSVDPQKVAYNARGTLIHAVDREFPEAQSWLMSQEFGTRPILPVLKTLRDENRVYHYGNPKQLDHPVKRRMMRTFCPMDKTWRRAILERGHRLAQDAAKIVFQTQVS